jgi:hypothetical protein
MKPECGLFAQFLGPQALCVHLVTKVGCDMWPHWLG